jgi:hypothetical protein
MGHALILFQGPGKSHSTSVLLESVLIRDDRLGQLPEPLSAIVYAILSFGCGSISRSFIASILTRQLEVGWCSRAKLRTWLPLSAFGEATSRLLRSQFSFCECSPSLGKTGSSHSWAPGRTTYVRCAWSMPDCRVFESSLFT